ncbi:MAG: ArnT family glycosyltransferase [Bacteroidia bacterium]
MGKYLKSHPNLLFLFFLTAFFFLNRYNEIIFFKPYSDHQWRQSDCYSIATNYYKENLPFLEPSIHFTSYRNNGKTISEFPMIYYTVAKLWGIFGLHAFIFRGLNLLILCIGLFCLFKLTTDLFQNSFIGIFIAGITVSSPVISYFGNNFLSDVPAFSLALCGWYFFYLFYRSSKYFFLLISTLFFLLASLLKITAFLSPVLILLCFAVEFFGLGKLKTDGSKVFANPLLQILPFLVHIFLLYQWLSYVKSYNDINHTGIFLTGILPFWEMDWGQRKEIIKLFYNYLLPLFHNPVVVTISIGCMLFSWLNFKRNNLVLSLISVFLPVGFIIFFALFFQVFSYHDYYLANWVIIFPFFIMNTLFILKNYYKPFYHSRFFEIGILMVFIYSMYYGAALTRTRYFSDDFLANENLTFKRVSGNYYKMEHEKYDHTLKAYETIEPYLRKLGIRREDKVINIPDYSFNICLAKMDQKGFTDFGFLETDSARVKKFMAMGAKYLIVNDSEVFTSRKYLNAFIKEKIGTYQNIQIFSLKNTY